MYPSSERAKEPLGQPLYALGDMVWVRIGNYPYWPAMVGVIVKFNFFPPNFALEKMDDSDFLLPNLFSCIMSSVSCIAVFLYTSANCSDKIFLKRVFWLSGVYKGTGLPVGLSYG